MKRFMILFALLINLSVYAQTDSTTLEQVVPDSTKIVEPKKEKETVNEKIANFFGSDKIKSLTITVQNQKEIIDSIKIELAKKPKIVTDTLIKTVKISVPTLNKQDAESIKKDEKFLTELPKSYNNLSRKDLSALTREIDDKISDLIKQREELITNGGNPELLNAKNNIIESLKREKNVINLSSETVVLKDENVNLAEQKMKLKKYLYISLGVLVFLILVILVITQRKTIKVQDAEIEAQLKDINKKNSYLDYAARIIRHDMHSGINTYIPRGITSLEKRISLEEQEELKIVPAVKMIKDGLNHTQRVYKNVYEFTNLVKQSSVLDKSEVNVKDVLEKFISNTAYSKQVQVKELDTLKVNEVLFCSAVDSLIKNGLNYNSNTDKKVVIYKEDNAIVIEDNGKGMTNDELQKHINSTKKESKDDNGLGLKICAAILEEHGFTLTCEKLVAGTKIKINL